MFRGECYLQNGEEFKMKVETEYGEFDMVRLQRFMIKTEEAKRKEQTVFDFDNIPITTEYALYLCRRLKEMLFQ
jgi:hypothetical protein